MGIDQFAKQRLIDMVMWKNAFEKLDTELDLTKRKKQALDNLLSAGRISQVTHDCLYKEIDEEVEQIEVRRKALTEKMTDKLGELEDQQQTLEFFLAHSEMAYAAGEINDEMHAKECSALGMGLDAVKQELNWIKDVILQLVPKDSLSPASVPSAPSTLETAEVSASPALTPVENMPNLTENVPLDASPEAISVIGKVAEEKPSQVTVETATVPEEHS